MTLKTESDVGDLKREQAKKQTLSELSVRVGSAIVMIVVSVLCAWFGGIWWAFLAGPIMAAITYEWNRMIAPKADDLVPRAIIAAICGFCFVLLPRAFEALAAFGFFLTMFRLPKVSGGIAIAGTVYLALSGWALAGLRGTDLDGRTLLFGLFAIVWATDSAAYAFGRTLGGPKLFPLISPNKTWSGSIGGTCAGVVAGMLYAVFSQTNLVSWAVIGWILASVSQAGDLLESLAKRHYGVKDASGVIPGHGGVLDRLDGHLAAALALVGLILLVPGLKAALT